MKSDMQWFEVVHPCYSQPIIVIRDSTAEGLSYSDSVVTEQQTSMFLTDLVCFELHCAFFWHCSLVFAPAPWVVSGLVFIEVNALDLQAICTAVKDNIFSQSFLPEMSGHQRWKNRLLLCWLRPMDWQYWIRAVYFTYRIVQCVEALLPSTKPPSSWSLLSWQAAY